LLLFFYDRIGFKKIQVYSVHIKECSYKAKDNKDKEFKKEFKLSIGFIRQS